MVPQIALRLAASALVQRIDLKPEDYVERLTVAKERLKLVDASISLSYESLTSDMQRLWCALAVFPDRFDTPAAAEMWKNLLLTLAPRIDDRVRSHYPLVTD